MEGSAASLVPLPDGKTQGKILRGFLRIRKMDVIEDPPEDGGKFLPRVTTHTDICMIRFPAEKSRYRSAPECPEL
jgi:hypothetical protein